MHATLVQALADGFWASMVAGRGASPVLEASVEALRDEQVVVPEERVDPHRYQPARSRAVRAFLDNETTSVLVSADDVVAVPVPLFIPPRKDGARAQPIQHDAVLLVTPAAEEEERANRIVCMRGTRMSVVERPVTDVPLGARRFQAVLLAGHASGSIGADADSAEAFLRTAEPPEHNDWKPTEDLTSTYARGAVTRLREFRKAMLDLVRETVRPTEADLDAVATPKVLRDLLKLDPMTPPRSPGYPTIRSATGQVDEHGAWHVRIEIKLPPRDDPWILRPLLRFATRSGPRPEAEWARIDPEWNCETANGDLMCTPGARSAVFVGVSDVTSHPVNAKLTMAEVDLVRVRGGVS